MLELQHKLMKIEIEPQSFTVEDEEEAGVRPHTSYVIFATPRSGSNFLCETLINTQLAGYPGEYFGHQQVSMLSKQWNSVDYASFLRKVIQAGTTPNGVFGVKIIWESMEDIIDGLREISMYEKLPSHQLLPSVFPNLHFIWLTRRDKVRQAISYAKALQTGIWAVFGSEPVLPSKEPVFRMNDIDTFMEGTIKDEVEIQQYFATLGIQPFSVVYEDFIANYEQISLQILEYLRVSVPQSTAFTPLKIKKQSDAQSEAWLQRYHQMAKSR